MKALTGQANSEIMVRDTITDGFFVRVSQGGRLSFGVAYCFAGKERRMTLGRHPELTVLAARKLAIKCRALAITGSDPLAQREASRRATREVECAPTMADLRTMYFETHVMAHRGNGEPKRSPEGVKNEVRYWRDILDVLGASTKIADLKADHVERMHRELSARAPANANRVHASLRCAIGLAIKKGWIDRNPAAGIIRNPEIPRERYLTQEEITRLRAAVEAHDDRVSALIVWFALLTGARRGEILKARWADIDLKVGVWVKPRATTKQRRHHRLPLSPEAIAALREIRTSAPSIDLVVPGNPESTLTRLKRAWTRIRRDAKLGDVRFHDLRHAHASILISSGCSLAVVGAALGHSQAQTTLRYAHLMDEPLRRATSLLGSFAEGKRTLDGRDIESPNAVESS